MHLKQLKLAGFKSFVDPTVVPFPGQRVAVVGPNGCGKSNIIDAVRWVMGESHAKHLRGESIADVIFKGSSGRKSVGQASVELVFDNSLGKLSGQYSSYQEISIKRVVTKDLESKFYLNGTRCRRRDITDIFLGTGAGARGYAIIGQNTISRIIEARPEELRAYMEEAAGVAKYKSRRQETCVRIASTRENLARVCDIIVELDKQLVRLERQARDAKRYRALKEDEHKIRAEIIVCKWQNLIKNLHAEQTELVNLETNDDSLHATLAKHNKHSEEIRAELNTKTTKQQFTQNEFYKLATEIARLEESLAQRERDKARLLQEKKELLEELNAAIMQLEQDNNSLSILENSVIVLEKNVISTHEELKIKELLLVEDAEEGAKHESSVRTLEASIASLKHEIELERTHIQHKTLRRQQVAIQLEKNQVEQQAIDKFALLQTQAKLEAEFREFNLLHDAFDKQYQGYIEQKSSYRDELATRVKILHQMQDQKNILVAEHAALTASLSKALHTKVTTNLKFAENKRVAELIVVEDDWIKVLECVLDDNLEAIVFDSFNDVWPILPTLAKTSLRFLKAGVKTKSSLHPKLTDKLTGFIPPNLEKVLAAENLTEALTWLESIADDESIVSKDGYWIGLNFVRILKLAEDDASGILSQQKDLAAVKLSLGRMEQEIELSIVKRDELLTLSTQHEQEENKLIAKLNETISLKNNAQLQLNNQKQKVVTAENRLAALEKELDLLQIELTEDSEELHIMEENIRQKTIKLSALEEESETQKSMLILWKTRSKQIKNELDESREAHFQAQLVAKQEMAKVESLRSAIARTNALVSMMTERKLKLQEEELAFTKPDCEYEQLLLEKTKKHTQIEQLLLDNRQQIESIEQQLDTCLQDIKHTEILLKELQMSKSQLCVNIKTSEDKISSLVLSLKEMEFNKEEIAENLDLEISISARETTLQTLHEKIKRLGAINLLAIEEYETDLARKESLELQLKDLTDALSLLEDAIKKLDAETKEKFNETFNAVNDAFKKLFPRLFGGGRANLALTCDNLLEAGILVMAEPPGKRNNTIQMLSGGEKAMTAIALVFAIFEQKPSPFCMLDEVDAPLDENNVRRFCDLVKDMSQFVQFLIITHNKVTMELADHLIGVTMREPGVSRVVAVDVEFMISDDSQK